MRPRVSCDSFHFPHNICHFLMDELFPLYVALRETDLLDKPVDICLQRRPTKHGYREAIFPHLYSLFGNVSFTNQHQENTRFVTSLGHDIPYLYPQKGDRGCSCATKSCDRTHYIFIGYKRWWSYVQEFADFIVDGLGLDRPEPYQITLINRVHMRKILNRTELISGLERIGVVEEVVMERLSLEDQLKTILRSRAVVAMHGAACCYAMWHPGAWVELMPYGYAYERFHRLALARGAFYVQWFNTVKENSFPYHPVEWLEGADMSTTILQDPSLPKTQGKTGPDLLRANKARGWYRDRDEIVDVQGISELVEGVI